MCQISFPSTNASNSLLVKEVPLSDTTLVGKSSVVNVTSSLMLSPHVHPSNLGRHQL